MARVCDNAAEQVVKITEFCDGEVVRTFYAIRDVDTGHWMSREPFDGDIWTHDPRRRRMFARRALATADLQALLDWRDNGFSPDDVTPEQRGAA